MAQTPPSPPSALARLLAQASRLLDRLPRHASALGTCALVLLLSVHLANDYGVWEDTNQQRAIGEATLRHLAGENGLNLLWPPSDRLYGPVVEVPLRLVERILYPDQGRGLYVARYLLTHLLFVASGFAGYLLALRMFGNRWLALFALALFLLHPRIYAHSFFNSKDVPFLSMFMICLWLAHRAFRPHRPHRQLPDQLLHVTPQSNGTAIYGAFTLCGVAAGLLTNLRVSGVTFVAVVILMRLCDAIMAGDWRERRRAIASCALFAFASVATFYATMPYLWADPLERFMEIVTVFSAHPTEPLQMFQGELVRGSEFPRSYLPVWFGITTPPLALLLGVVGFSALAWRVATGLSTRYASRNPLRNSPLRFELLVATCFVLPVLVAVALRPTLYDGWRHFYFLWTPFVLMAASGLGALTEFAREACRRFLPPHVPTAAVAGLAVLCLGATVVEVVRLHPRQHLYFNVLVIGSGAAQPLGQRYHIPDQLGRTLGLTYILERAERYERDKVFNVRMCKSRERHKLRERGLGIKRPLPLRCFRGPFKFDENVDSDFYVGDGHTFGRRDIGYPPVLYDLRIYGKQIVQVATPDLSRIDEATAQSYRALYRRVTSGTPSLSGPDVDIYVGEKSVFWAMEACPPGGVNKRMPMAVIPLDAAQGPRGEPPAHGVRVGGACLWRAPLPARPIAKILFPHIGAFVADAHLEELRQRYLALTKPPVVRSTFDVYLEARTLLYLKTPCVQKDADAPFFVHVWPAHVGDLPSYRRRHGFDALDFRFGGFDPQWNYVSSDIFDNVCLATLELPGYPLAKITTGQYVPGGDSLWRVDIGGD